MPITLPPISRRRFLTGTLAAAAAATLARSHAFGQIAPADPNRIILFSDVHIAADPTTVARDVNMTDHLRQAVAEALQSVPNASAAIVNGDLAFNHGLPGDYASVVNLLKPLRAAGIPVHLSLGNHDDRQQFWKSIPPEEGGGDADLNRPVEDRNVLVMETPSADFLLLDSLDKTASTPGVLGKPQLQWLSDRLAGHKDKPVIVMVHHQPVLPETAPFASHNSAKVTTKPTGKIGGIVDTDEFMDIVLPNKQVKAVLFGHTHFWGHAQKEGLHLVNLPAVAYVFNPTQTSAWTDLTLRPDGASIVLHTLDHNQPNQGEKIDLTWRT